MSTSTPTFGSSRLHLALLVVGPPNSLVVVR